MTKIDPTFRDLRNAVWIEFPALIRRFEFGGVPGSLGVDSLAKSPRWE
jgi:hypothetical protein